MNNNIKLELLDLSIKRIKRRLKKPTIERLKYIKAYNKHLNNIQNKLSFEDQFKSCIECLNFYYSNTEDRAFLITELNDLIKNLYGDEVNDE